ncbi:MAG: protease modulator HflC [Burkholderiales bacterium]|nr:protease modulator HflC [Burkholderiales bacterium]
MKPGIIGAIIAALAIGSSSMFTVDQRQSAIVLQLGEIVSIKQEPGLYFKIPLVQNIHYFDTRILTFESPEPERYITSEKKNVLVDSFVKWRIVDPKQYYISTGGDETRAQLRLSQTINSSLRDEIGTRTVHDVISGQRDMIVALMRDKADLDARKIGVQVVDVRLKRVDLPQQVSDSVYRRMQAERKRVANELRSTGAAESEQIRADADRQRQVIIAEAYREAQKVKGEGDAAATAIYAKAFSGNPEFYAFYRSLEAYRKSFNGQNSTLVLEPNSEFFKYFRNPGDQTK